MTKLCSKCKETRSLSQFYKDKNNKDGLRSSCKPCVVVYNNNNKASIAAKDKRWNANNQNKAKAIHQNWAVKNRDKCNAYAAKYRTIKLDQTPSNQSNLELALINALYTAAQILGNTCGEPFEVDHIHPVSKGGMHSFVNLQVLTRSDNRSKRTKVL